MKLVQWVFVFMLAASPAATWAEFYRYVDEQGNVHYTDDLAEVPAEKRPKAETYEEALEQPAPEKGTEIENQQEETPKKPLANQGEESAPQPSLRERGMELDAEYQLLMKEREQLSKAGDTPLAAPEREQLAERIRDFNKRMEDYEKRRVVFNEEVEAYNASLTGKGPPSKAQE